MTPNGPSWIVLNIPLKRRWSGCFQPKLPRIGFAQQNGIKRVTASCLNNCLRCADIDRTTAWGMMHDARLMKKMTRSSNYKSRDLQTGAPLVHPRLAVGSGILWSELKFRRKIITNYMHHTYPQKIKNYMHRKFIMAGKTVLALNDRGVNLQASPSEWVLV